MSCDAAGNFPQRPADLERILGDIRKYFGRRGLACTWWLALGLSASITGLKLAVPSKYSIASGVLLLSGLLAFCYALQLELTKVLRWSLALVRELVSRGAEAKIEAAGAPWQGLMGDLKGNLGRESRFFVGASVLYLPLLATFAWSIAVMIPAPDGPRPLAVPLFLVALLATGFGLARFWVGRAFGYWMKFLGEALGPYALPRLEPAKPETSAVERSPDTPPEASSN